MWNKEKGDFCLKTNRLFGIKWYKHLYLGASIKHESKRIKYKIIYHQRIYGYCLVTLPANTDNLLDIIYSETLSLPYYKEQSFDVIGLAGSKTEAFELVGHIVEEVYHKTGGFDIKRYLGYI